MLRSQPQAGQKRHATSHTYPQRGQAEGRAGSAAADGTAGTPGAAGATGASAFAAGGVMHTSTPARASASPPAASPSDDDRPGLIERHGDDRIARSPHLERHPDALAQIGAPESPAQVVEAGDRGRVRPPLVVEHGE